MAVAAAGLMATTVAAPPALGAQSGTCSPFTVATAGQTYRGDQKRTLPAADIGSRIQVRGKYVRFTVQSSTFTVRDYTLTGADSPRPDKDLPLDAPTVVFESKVPQHGALLNSAMDLELDDDGLVFERNGGGQDMKIQAKNCAQGGLFQMEPEPAPRTPTGWAPTSVTPAPGRKVASASPTAPSARTRARSWPPG